MYGLRVESASAAELQSVEGGEKYTACGVALGLTITATAFTGVVGAVVGGTYTAFICGFGW